MVHAEPALTLYTNKPFLHPTAIVSEIIKVLGLGCFVLMLSLIQVNLAFCL